MNTTTRVRITDEQTLARGLEALVRLDPRLAEVAAACSPLPWRTAPATFEGLAEIVVSQLVSRAAATTILGRLRAAVGPLEPAAYLAAGDSARKAGLSGAKHRTLTFVADEILSGRMDLAALADGEPDELRTALLAVPGIGPWSADIFALFCAGSSNAFPAGDVAVQAMMAEVLDLAERPDAKSATVIAEAWQPWRGVAVRLLYAHWAARKGGPAAPL